ncbi:MAG TPA: SusC/RagA family TonB-linked outer membrane protein [Gemmatimonadaceae bacterium]|nr:SusC/RagA family TonB-linked outer membrane protein [Gemmatimonadaceae bacterium]
MNARRSTSGALVASLLVGGALLAAPCARAAAQQSTGRIEGTVTDARSQQPLSAASVFIQNTGIGSQTNDRGRFVLVNLPPGSYQVRVRRIGFTNAVKTVAVQAGETATADFALTEAPISLEEVVVTGTAAVTRAKEVPTSTDIVNMQTLRNAPVANAQEVIAGRIPSVTVEANSGQPGAGGSIKIRGTNTLTQSVMPLMYVDGVRIYNEITRNNWGARTASNPLQDINPDDIERIEVVKGAAATTLYGTEAAGGVIQIFTKKGVAGRPQWDANLTTGANVNYRWGDRHDPTQLFTECGDKADMYGIATSKTTVGTTVYQKGDRVPFQDPTCPADGNWTDPGPIQQYDLSVRGGNQKVTYFVSGNFGDVQGILQTQRSKDGGFRGNFAFFPMDKLQLSVNSAYTRRNTRWAGDGNNSEGFLLNVGRGWRGYFQGGVGDQCAVVPSNEVCVTNGNTFDQTLTTKSDHYLSGVNLNYNPTEHLSNRLAVGWDYTIFNNVTNLPFAYQDFPEGYFWDENSSHTKLSLDYAGSYLSNVWRVPNLASTFSWGGQLFRDRNRYTEIDVQNFAGPGDPTLTTGSELTYRQDLPSAITNAGFFFQEQLGFHDRLFVTGGLRVDGNSAFGENFGLQTYPKLGFSYVLSDFGFWPKSWLETFKLRGAVGESGKAPGAFDKLRTWTPITGDENKPGFTPSNVGNPDLGPERTRELEGGFDASALGGLIGTEFTYYNARTFDALIPVPRPPSGGFSNAQLQNVGEIRNSGVELQLNLALLRLRNFDWRLRANGNRMWNRAVDLGESAPGFPITEVYTGLNSWVKVGRPFPQYYGPKVTNPNADAAPVIDPDAQLGNVSPDRMWGLGTTLTFFNNLSLDAFLEHQGGFVVQNYTAYQNARRGVWQPCYDVQEKTVAAANAGTTLTGVRAIDRARCAFKGYDIGFWTEKGDFTKLRYVSLTYNLPARLIHTDRASVTFSARNLFTWSPYHGADPEVQDVADQAGGSGDNEFGGRFGRRDYYQIPQPRTFTISLRTTF